MKTRNKIISALMSASILFTSVAPSMTINAGAATTMFDGTVEVFSVYPEYFMVNGQLCTPFNDALKSALGKEYDVVTFNDLNKISTLSLSGKNLTGVPKVIEYMERLKVLNLANNKLVTYTASEIAEYKAANGESDSLGAINNLDLSDQIYLTSVDLSGNYLTVAPSWYISLGITTKKIANNLINANDQRQLVAGRNSFYYMLGDTIDIDALKERIVSSVQLNDGTELPTYFYDPLLPTYVFPDGYNANTDAKNENISVTIDLASYLKDKVVSKTGTITGKVKLLNAADANTHTTAEFKVYLLDEKDVSSAKIRLESVITEAKLLKEADYTASTWAPFKTALTSAQSIYSYTDATVDMTKQALESLTSKMNALVKGLSTSTKKIMTDMIAIAKTLKEEGYTSESWAVFSEAVSLLTAASNNKDTSLNYANALIEKFQTALDALVANKIVLPMTATKADFESVYGENKTLTYTGTTRDGYEYTWVFNGKDVATPADANLEVKLQSTLESEFLKAIGSPNFIPLQLVQKGAFPAVGKLKLGVSKLYKAEKLYLYSYNNTTKKAELVSESTAADGFVTFSFSAGGEYFITSTKISYDIISTKFNINAEKQLISGVAAGTAVKEFKTYLTNGGSVKVYNSDGTEAPDTAIVGTGMTAKISNGDTSYTIAIIGDIDGDGAKTIFDALVVMKALVGSLELSTYAQKIAADFTGDGYVRIDDALELLKSVVG